MRKGDLSTAGVKKKMREKIHVRNMRRKQRRIMAEVRKRQIRGWLKNSRYISLSLDAGQNRKVVRFRCSLAEEPFVATGIMGTFDITKTSRGDLEEDHAKANIQQLNNFLDEFCTPLVKSPRPLARDDELKDHIVNHTRVLTADGCKAERRAFFFACTSVFPYVILVLRDPAHALRIACRNPLHFDDLFGEVWQELFDSKNALVPNIQSRPQLSQG